MFPVKQLLLLVFCTCSFIVSLAQGGKDTIPVREHRDTTSRIKKDTPRIKKDTTLKIMADTALKAVTDTTVAAADSARPAKTPVVVSRPDTGIPVASVMKGAPLPEPKPTLEGFTKVLQSHPYFNFYGKGVKITEQLKKESRDESMFYFLCALLFYFGFIRVAFIKYIDNLKTLFLRVTMRQQQIRDQVLQSPLPSLMLNILFVISAGLFLSFVADYYNIVPGVNRWLFLVSSYCLK
jgi:hypothetical protein